MAKPVKYLLLAASILLLATAILFFRFSRHGLSAHDEPTKAEVLLARTLRHYATPADLRHAKNPLSATPEILAEAKAHFADHCASCHGNDGKGTTTLAQRLYPRAPDMTLEETQSLSDGEIFATIENGIRLTGMPGWGDGSAESARGSWGLVHFIRNLSKLSEADLREEDEPYDRRAVRADEGGRGVPRGRNRLIRIKAKNSAFSAFSLKGENHA